MEPLEPDKTAMNCYSPYPCEFRHIAEELERMTGSDVNVVVQVGMSGPEVVRMNGRLGLAEEVTGWESKRARYPVGDDEDTGFEICEEEFTRGQFIPGRVWLELKSGVVLTVERRHFPPELEETA